MSGQESDTLRYVPVSGTELAEMLGVNNSRISTAAHREWKVHGKPVFQWAEWHPNGRAVERYLVPHEFAMSVSVSEDLAERLIEREKVTRTKPLSDDEDDEYGGWRAPHPEA